MRNILKDATQGLTVLATLHGHYKPNHSQSPLKHALDALGYTSSDIGKRIDIIIGGKHRDSKRGYHMAIVKIAD